LAAHVVDTGDNLRAIHQRQLTLQSARNHLGQPVTAAHVRWVMDRGNRSSGTSPLREEGTLRARADGKHSWWGPAKWPGR